MKQLSDSAIARDGAPPNAGASGKAAKLQAASPRSVSVWKRLRQQWDIQLMIVPAVIFLIVMSYVPMWGVLMAFQNYDIFTGFFGSDWVGLKHFQSFFHATEFNRVMSNTIVVSLLKLVILFPAPIILALMLNEVKLRFFKRTVQSIMYLPHFISWVIVSGFVFSLLSYDNGFLNLVLLKLHLIDDKIGWLSHPNYFYTVLISSNLWKDIGFGSIVYLAAIAGVNPSLYEAAQVDGAGRIKQIMLVTIPSILPIVTIFFILDVGKLLNAGFEDILILTNNGKNAILNPVSEVIDTYVYKRGINDLRYSYATAVGLFKSVINIALLVLANQFARRAGRESLW